MSSLPAPGWPPPRKAPEPPLRPVVVPRRPRPRRFAALGVAALAAALAAVALLLRLDSSGTGGPADVAARTAVVTAQDLERTIRIGGVISAERYAAVMAPQMVGSRSGRGRDGSSRSSGGAGQRGGSSGGVTSGSSSSSGSSGSTSSSNAIAGMPSQTGVGASAAIGSTSTSATTGAGGLNALGSQAGPVSNSGLDAQSSTSSLGAQRGSTNRFQPRPPRQSSSSRRSGGGDNAMAGGIGSTGGNLISSGMRGGGGGGGSGAGMSGGFGGVGGGEFMLILLEVAKPGSRVRKGDIVAEFDRQYQERRLDDYRASVIQLEANVKKLKADLMVAKEAHAQLVRTARASLEKARLDLKTVEVRSAIEAEKFRLVAEEADAHYGQSLKEVALVETSHRAQLRATEIDRDQAKIELERAEKNINRMIVRAPIDGIVVMQSIWRGGDMGQVQQGDQIPPGMFFMSIVDPSSMVINATVNQVDSEMLRLGMKAVARLDAYPGLELPASIQGIAAMARTGGWRASFVREIPVRLKLDRIDPRVIPDLSASAEILLSSEPRAAVLPLAAVFREPDGERPFVFVQSPAGWQRREVELGLSNNIAVAARSGVKPGDVVATEKPGSGNVQRDPA